MGLISINTCDKNEYDKIISCIPSDNLAIDELGNFHGNAGDDVTISIKLEKDYIRPVVDVYESRTETIRGSNNKYHSDTNTIDVSFIVPDSDVTIFISHMSDLFNLYCDKKGLGRMIQFIVSGNISNSPTVKSCKGAILHEFEDDYKIYFAKPGDAVEFNIDLHGNNPLFFNIFSMVSKTMIQNIPITYLYHDELINISFIMPEYDVIVYTKYSGNSHD